MRLGRTLAVGLMASMAVLGLSSCGGGGGAGDKITLPVFPAVTPLTPADVTTVLMRAAQSIDAPDLSVAVTDRIGNILGVFIRNPATTPIDQNLAVSLARTGAFMSSSQGPLTSRTLEFISTFHFPATFGAPAPLPNPLGFDFTALAQQRTTTGVMNTAQGPLWQIFASNRGAPLAGMGLTTGQTGVETLYDAGQAVPPATNINGSAPGPGLTYLPGGVPLFKGGRVVGGVGCFGASPEACEFAAIAGALGAQGAADNFFFSGIPPEGGIFLVGVLLPYVQQLTRPAGFGPGSFVGTTVVPPTAGAVDPFGNLISPRADPLGHFTLAQVQQIVNQGIATANGTRAAIRLPLGTATKMVIAVTNLDGLILALHRMEDAPIFSIDVAVAKARNVTYFSSAAVDPLDAVPGCPPGTAITNRTLGFMTQPFFPPGIDSLGPTPLFSSIALFNQNPTQFNRQGHAPFRPGLQNGVILFPGATPLYDSSGVLIGGLGVSGDGVEQDDFVTNGSGQGFLPPPPIRADNFFFQGVRLPFFKFPQLPGPGNG